MGQYDLALADLGKAIELNPDDTEAYTSRFVLYGQLGKYEQALGDLAKAIELQPQSAQAHNNLAWLLATCPDVIKYRDAEKAVAHATRACELSGWDNFIPLDSLAASYAEAGKFSEAIRWLNKAEDLAPTDVKSKLQSRLELYKAGKAYRDERKE